MKDFKAILDLKKILQLDLNIERKIFRKSEIEGVATIKTEICTVFCSPEQNDVVFHPEETETDVPLLSKKLHVRSSSSSPNESEERHETKLRLKVEKSSDSDCGSLRYRIIKPRKDENDSSSDSSNDSSSDSSADSSSDDSSDSDSEADSEERRQTSEDLSSPAPVNNVDEISDYHDPPSADDSDSGVPQIPSTSFLIKELENQERRFNEAIKFYKPSVSYLEKQNSEGKNGIINIVGDVKV